LGRDFVPFLVYDWSEILELSGTPYQFIAIVPPPGFPYRGTNNLVKEELVKVKMLVHIMWLEKGEHLKLSVIGVCEV